jgi:predicted GNAT family N-acyltransferase
MNNKLIATGKILIEKKFQDSQAHIEDIVVDKDYRRMGYSKKILQRLLDISRENFCYKVSLCARKNLSRVYESVGFVDNGQHFVMYL